jgi:hypothetical protein
MTKRIFEIESVLSENFLLFCEIFIGISFLQAIIWYSISRFIKHSVRKNKKIEMNPITKLIFKLFYVKSY